jgi:hypothetical protein
MLSSFLVQPSAGWWLLFSEWWMYRGPMRFQWSWTIPVHCDLLSALQWEICDSWEWLWHRDTCCISVHSRAHIGLHTTQHVIMAVNNSVGVWRFSAGDRTQGLQLPNQAEITGPHPQPSIQQGYWFMCSLLLDVRYPRLPCKLVGHVQNVWHVVIRVTLTGVFHRPFTVRWPTLFFTFRK